nr:MAG TPA: hypothetical protein [Caudoviricetes sp.]
MPVQRRDGVPIFLEARFHTIFMCSLNRTLQLSYRL